MPNLILIRVIEQQKVRMPAAESVPNDMELEWSCSKPKYDKEHVPRLFHRLAALNRRNLCLVSIKQTPVHTLVDTGALCCDCLSCCSSPLWWFSIDSAWYILAADSEIVGSHVGFIASFLELLTDIVRGTWKVAISA